MLIFSTTYLIPEDQQADMQELRYCGYELDFSDGMGTTTIRQNLHNRSEDYR